VAGHRAAVEAGSSPHAHVFNYWQPALSAVTAIDGGEVGDDASV
jgi:hypothetical protein